MRKLLSLLAISAIVGSTATNVVSCRKKTNENLKDISQINFNDPVVFNNEQDATGQALYEYACKKIATFAGDVVKSSDISKKNGITVEIKQGTDTIPNDSRYVGPFLYSLKITVAEGNKWFAQTTTAITKVLQVIITQDQVDISDKKFDDIQYSTNKDVYRAIRTQIASWWSNSEVVLTGNDIKNDEHITIGVYQQTASNEDKLIAENAVSSLNPTNNYDAKITVIGDDCFFKPIDAKIADLNLTFNKVDLSTMTLEEDYANSGSDVYNSVRDQIAKKINVEGVDATTIKNDEDASKITITIIAPDGTTPISDDSSTVLSTSGDYKVTISSTSDNQYLIGQITNATFSIIQNENVVDWRIFVIAQDVNDPSMFALYDSNASSAIKDQQKVVSRQDGYAPTGGGYLGQYPRPNSSDTPITKSYENSFFSYDAINKELEFISNDKTTQLVSNDTKYESSTRSRYLTLAPSSSELETNVTVTITPSGYMIIKSINSASQWIIKNGDSWLSSGHKYKLDPYKDI